MTINLNLLKNRHRQSDGNKSVLKLNLPKQTKDERNFHNFIKSDRIKVSLP